MANADSILSSTKKMLGVGEEDDSFDIDIMLHINSVFGILYQLGVGPSEPFIITGYSESWDDFTDGRASIEMVKSYMYTNVRMLFDPPTNSNVQDALNKKLSELEWRLNIAVDPGIEEVMEDE